MEPRRKWNDLSRCDICLINPPWVTKSNDIWHGIKAAMPPLSLLSIASYLEKEGRNVAIIDVHVEGLSALKLKERISRLQPRIVGITVMTATAIQANLIARLIKEVDNSIKTVMGGIHAEVLPEECLRNKAVDVVVRGDGEVTFSNFCTAVLKGESYRDIPGLSFRDNNIIVHNPDAELIKDLNLLPMPSYHLVPMHRYHPAVGAYRKLPAINMLMTRGCPGRCSFCNSASTPLRIRDAGIIFNEILRLRKQYGIREIQFYDDTFVISKKNVLKFCALMKESKLGITWTAFARSDCIDEEMARAMRKGGCHQVMIGVESADQNVLRQMGKPIPLEKTEKAIKIVRDAGIEVRCTFIYGCEGETMDSMRKTLDFALKLDSDIALFNIATPYPGTRLFNWAKSKGYLMTEEWSEYDLGNPVINLPNLPPEKIVKFYQKSFRTYYIRPKAILRRVMKLTSIQHCLDALSAFCFIMSRHKFGSRGIIKQDWINYTKNDFF